MVEQKKCVSNNERMFTIEDVHGNVKFVGSQMDVIKEATRLLAEDYEKFMGEPLKKIRDV